MTEELWRYDKPHPSGGNCAVTMTRQQAIDGLRKAHCIGTDDTLFDVWKIENWAYRVPSAEFTDEQLVKLVEVYTAICLATNANQDIQRIAAGIRAIIDHVAAPLLERIAVLEAENTRLKKGNFTPDEMQNLCHNLTTTDAQTFATGCTEYQCKLFGCAPVSDALAAAQAENESLRGDLSRYSEREQRTMDHNSLRQSQIVTLQKQLARAQAEIAVDDGLLAAYRKVLALIPECAGHGGCLPHAEDWIAEARQDSARLDALEALLLKDWHQILINEGGVYGANLNYNAEPNTIVAASLRMAVDAIIALRKEDSSQ